MSIEGKQKLSTKDGNSSKALGLSASLVVAAVAFIAIAAFINKTKHVEDLKKDDVNGDNGEELVADSTEETKKQEGNDQEQHVTIDGGKDKGELEADDNVDIENDLDDSKKDIDIHNEKSIDSISEDGDKDENVSEQENADDDSSEEDMKTEEEVEDIDVNDGAIDDSEVNEGDFYEGSETIEGDNDEDGDAVVEEETE